MIYTFKFTQKPFRSPILGQVETENFYKWFMENAPYGVRLEGRPLIVAERVGGVMDFTNNFARSVYAGEIDLESGENSNDE